MKERERYRATFALDVQEGGRAVRPPRHNHDARFDVERLHQLLATVKLQTSRPAKDSEAIEESQQLVDVKIGVIQVDAGGEVVWMKKERNILRRVHAEMR